MKTFLNRKELEEDEGGGREEEEERDFVMGYKVKNLCLKHLLSFLTSYVKRISFGFFSSRFFYFFIFYFSYVMI